MYIHLFAIGVTKLKLCFPILAYSNTPFESQLGPKKAPWALSKGPFKGLLGAFKGLGTGPLRVPPGPLKCLGLAL